jgi:5-carboxymethyl-2-hydroxymuconate isomerase
MPHVVIHYTPNVEADIQALCRELADSLIEQKDEAGGPLFPPGGTRVMAYPAAHYAVADGRQDYAFVYINVKIAGGRSAAAKTRAGDAMMEKVKARFASQFGKDLIGITLQIEESPGQVYDGKHNNLHPLFNK